MQGSGVQIGRAVVFCYALDQPDVQTGAPEGVVSGRCNNLGPSCNICRQGLPGHIAPHCKSEVFLLASVVCLLFCKLTMCLILQCQVLASTLFPLVSSRAFCKLYNAPRVCSILCRRVYYDYIKRASDNMIILEFEVFCQSGS
jgi:hypothetical protein